MNTKHLIIYLLIFVSTTPLLAQLDNSSLLLHANEIITSEGALEIVDEKEAIYYEKKRIIILNSASKANAFAVYYDPESKILDLDADIYDLNGQPIRKVRKSEIRDVAVVDGVSIYTENRVKYIELTHSEYPYILEFSYRQRLKGLDFAVGRNWYFQDRSTSAVTSSSYTVEVPKGMDIQYQLYNLEQEPKITQSEESTTYQWEANDLPAIKLEPYNVPGHRLVPILRISPSKFQIDDYTGSMQSWEAYGEFLEEIWSDRDQLPEELKQQIQTLITDADNDKEKIARLYRFMQENKRYVSVQLGIGGWQPFTAEYVEERGYGDCKALSNYMKAILGEAGIESYPVIIKASGHHPYEVEDDFVDPDFNHAILYVPSEDTWLECTSPITPPGYLGEFCNDRKVLLITPQGGTLARTPKLSTAENLRKEQVMIELASDGSATLDYLANLQGIPHEDWRYYNYAYTPGEIENKVRNIGKLPTLNLAQVNIENAPDSPQSTLSFSATATRYASRAGKRLFVPLNLICPRTYVPDVVEDRKHPIQIRHGYSQEATIVFTIPEGFKTESLPKPQNIETVFGKYQMQVTESEGKVTLHRLYQMYDDEQTAEQYEAFREFLASVAKYDGSKMVLVSE